MVYFFGSGLGLFHFKCTGRKGRAGTLAKKGNIATPVPLVAVLIRASSLGVVLGYGFGANAGPSP